MTCSEPVQGLDRAGHALAPTFAAGQEAVSIIVGIDKFPLLVVMRFVGFAGEIIPINFRPK